MRSSSPPQLINLRGGPVLLYFVFETINPKNNRKHCPTNKTRLKKMKIIKKWKRTSEEAQDKNSTSAGSYGSNPLKRRKTRTHNFHCLPFSSRRGFRNKTFVYFLPLCEPSFDVFQWNSTGINHCKGGRTKKHVHTVT